MNDDNKIQLARRVEAWARDRTLTPAVARLVDDLLDVADMRGEEHPATLGCLVALMREAWGDQTLTVVWDIKALVWYVPGALARAKSGRERLLADTEAEALVRTLEAAPDATEAPRLPHPDNMHGACDGFGGEDAC